MTTVTLGLTEAQRSTLEFVRHYARGHKGVTPSYDEIATHLGLRAKSGVARIINELKARGAVEVSNLPRSLVIVDSVDLKMEVLWLQGQLNLAHRAMRLAIVALKNENEATVKMVLENGLVQSAPDNVD